MLSAASDRFENGQITHGTNCDSVCQAFTLEDLNFISL
jgi:hypothetical protein